MGFIGPESKHGQAFRHGVDCHIKASGFCTQHWVHHPDSPVWAEDSHAVGLPVFSVEVGFTRVRPIIVDELINTVIVAAANDVEATLIAAQIVDCRPGVTMVTSTNILDWETP